MTASAPSPRASSSLASLDEVAITHATTDGMNLGTWALDWRDGGRAVTTCHEHPGGVGPLYMICDRFGVDLAFAEFNESNGTTTIRYYPGGILTAAPAIATIEGATTSGLGVSGTGLVAGVTFKGISVANFGAGGSVSTYPGTNSIIARDVQMSGNALFVLTGSTLQHWDAGTKTLKREVALDTTGVTTHATGGSTSAVVATAEGLSTIQYASGSKAPSQLAAGSANRYYRDAVAGDRLLHLFDSRSVDIVPLDSSGMPGTPRNVALSGSIVDIAPAALRHLAHARDARRGETRHRQGRRAGGLPD